MHVPAQMVNAILTVMALIVLDTVVGWIGALASKQWDWHKVSQFLETSVLPYIGGLLAFMALAVIKPDITPAFYAAVAAADVKLVADLIKKISNLGVKTQ